MEAILDDLGRIVIPKQMRDDLGLNPGTILRVEERENKIVLTPALPQEALVVNDGVLVFTGEVEGDLERALHRDRQERSLGLTGLD